MQPAYRDLVQKWSERNSQKESDRGTNHFFVSVAEIRNNNYDLSVNRYSERARQDFIHVSPKQLIEELTDLEREIERGLKDLEARVQ